MIAEVMLVSFVFVGLMEEGNDTGQQLGEEERGEEEEGEVVYGQGNAPPPSGSLFVSGIEYFIEDIA